MRLGGGTGGDIKHVNREGARLEVVRACEIKTNYYSKAKHMPRVLANGAFFTYPAMLIPALARTNVQAIAAAAVRCASATASWLPRSLAPPPPDIALDPPPP